MITNSATLLRNLLEADRQFDKAQDDLCAAKRAAGKATVNPLDRMHPAVINKRRAVEQRAEAMRRATVYFGN